MSIKWEHQSEGPGQVLCTRGQQSNSSIHGGCLLVTTIICQLLIPSSNTSSALWAPTRMASFVDHGYDVNQIWGGNSVLFNSAKTKVTEHATRIASKLGCACQSLGVTSQCSSGLSSCGWGLTLHLYQAPGDARVAGLQPLSSTNLGPV